MGETLDRDTCSVPECGDVLFVWQRVRPKTGTGRITKNVRINMLKGKMIMTFKDNVPQRWIENPERLPVASVTENDGGGFKTLLSDTNNKQ